jgi:hypothetical protein
VDHVGALVHDLVDLFPVMKPAQETLRNHETEELHNIEGLDVLKGNARAHDTMLATALA